MLDLFLKGQVKDIQVWGLFVEEEWKFGFVQEPPKEAGLQDCVTW